MTATATLLTAEERLAHGAAYHAALTAVVEAPQAVDLAALRVELARRLGAGERPAVALAVEDVFSSRPARV